MKKLLVATFAGLALIGCDKAPDPQDKSIENNCTRFTYMNHSYLRFEEVYKYTFDRYNNGGIGSRICIVHNPDCPCHSASSCGRRNAPVEDKNMPGVIESPAFEVSSPKK